MRLQVGIENNFEGRSLAWVLGHPGCFAYGIDGEGAYAALPQVVVDYAAWIAAHNQGECWVDSRHIELQWAETWDVYTIDEAYDLAEQGYEVNAFFRHDWKPLMEEDIQCGQLLLAWSRMDLLATVANLSLEALATRHPGERWDLSGILKHVGGAEWWYLDRLGFAFSPQEVPDDPFERLDVVRKHLLQALPRLTGVTQVVGVDGEIWSPRKLLRRTLWHERDHTIHILKLRQNLV